MGYEAGPELESGGAGGLASAVQAADDAAWATLLSLDWFNRAGCLYWQAQPGKTGIWLDMDGVFIQGRNGRWLERELAGMGVTIYAKMLAIVDGCLLALIVVAKRHADRVRRWLSKKEILVQ
jgi:hypothetical protein